MTKMNAETLRNGSGRIPGLSREEEEANLREILDIAQNNLDKAKEDIKKMGDDVAELYESVEQSDKETLILWNDATIRLTQLKRDMGRFEKARKKPYFGRIDFKDPLVKHEESYYIGRVGIFKTPSEPVVLDWRAPISSVYYENTLGPCQYTVSSEGTYEIDLRRKRTYSIEKDRLKDFFDSDVVANDDLLTSYLAKNKKAVLGEIIATIQKEQNLIIRRSPKTNMIVQGCAGSGKTTVAMHRISYILYNYEDSFRPEDFYIIGSNKILLNYITSVLPELDVYGVSQMTMEELFVRLLYEDWDVTRHKIRSLDKKDEITCIKGTKDWFDRLSAFCDRYEEKKIPRQEVYMKKNGPLLIGKVLIDTYCKNNPTLSMQAKCLMLNEILMAKYENEIQGKNVSYTPEDRRQMEKKFATYFGKDEWNGSIFELYEAFLEEQKVAIPKDCFDVYDLAALAFLYKRIKEIDPIREASHVVIDEAQDFGMMAYCSLHYCLRNCTYTIMGDTSQNIHFGYGLNDWEELRKLILTGTYDSFGLLKKSYRNTVEISNFATNILRHGDFSIYPVEPIVRHGDEVVLTDCKDVSDMYEKTVAQIKDWQKEGYETIAVVCRDEAESKQVWQALSASVEILDGTDKDAEFGNGVMVLPVAYTKGLEFDCVLLFHPTREHYPAEDTYVKLLYVAATRALHQLVVLYAGDLTGLIADPVPSDKHQTELSAPTLTKAFEYERVVLTQKEMIVQQIADGDKDMAERHRIGPKRILMDGKKIKAAEDNTLDMKKYLYGESYASQPDAAETTSADRRDTKSEAAKTANTKTGDIKTENTRTQKAGSAPSEKMQNQSPYAFLSMPTDPSVLKPKGHSKSDFAIRWIKKDKAFVELSSQTGILRIEPIRPEVIRVRFWKGQQAKTELNCFNQEAMPSLSWKVKDAREYVDVITEKLVVRVEKKNGAVGFYQPNGKLLLQEKKTEPRQLQENCNWTYFEWEKSEKFKAKGMLKEDLTDITAKARYVSHGGKSLRLPLVLSGKGYAVAMAAEDTVLFCNIPSYGNYLFCDKSAGVDYYFLGGGNHEQNLKLYDTFI